MIWDELPQEAIRKINRQLPQRTDLRQRKNGPLHLRSSELSD